MLVTLPFVLLLLDYWPLRRLKWRTVAEKIPLIILSVISCVVTYIVQQSGGAITEIRIIPLGLRLSNALVSCASYLGKMIYPTDLAVLYPFPINGLPWWQPTCAFLLLASLSVFAVYTARRGRYILTGWLWYLGTLVPVIGLVKIGVQAMADRYTYLPSIGIFIAIAWGAVQLLSRWRHCRLALGISAGLLIGLMIICTRQQVHYWRDSFTLYKHALNVTENNYKMHHNLGSILSAQGKLDEAIRHYRRALQIWPSYAQAYNNLGNMLSAQGKLDEATRHYRRALEIRPDSVEVHNNLGSVLAMQGKLDEAIRHYRRALEIRPDSVQAHRNLERALAEQGKLEQAIDR
jgi:predicted TPR repeat methyltransferase